MALTIAIDCMGGDHGPQVTVPGALEFLKLHGDAQVILVGLEDLVRGELRKARADNDARVRVCHAPQMVSMEESPASALRAKKGSSMRVVVDLVKRGEAQAAVSAGNTGALMAISRFVLKTLPGIDRPAIISVLPTLTGTTHMLEVLERICMNQSRPGDQELMERIGQSMKVGSLCGHGQLGYNPILSAFKYFADEFDASIKAHKGPVGPFPDGSMIVPSRTRP